MKNDSANKVRSLLEELGFRKKKTSWTDTEAWIKESGDFYFVFTFWNLEDGEDFSLVAEIKIVDHMSLLAMTEVLAVGRHEISMAWLKESVICPLCKRAYKVLEKWTEKIAESSVTGDI